jgi:site-specific DNA recombinase
MSNKPVKALIYCRVSSERQKNEGHGLDSQEYRCREYARFRGYEVEKVFKDSYSGGGDFMKRPAMSELLAYSDKHFDNNYTVIFDDLSRFARDTVFHIQLRRAFKVRGLTPECLNFSFDDSPEGKFAETVLAASNELDREKNRRQVSQKMKARLEKGYWTFPAPPPGYTFKKDPIHGKVSKG